MAYSEGDLGYAAGAVDSEGCIDIAFTKAGGRNRQASAWGIQVSVTNTDPRMPLKMYTIFQLGRTCERSSTKKGRRNYMWSVRGRDAGLVLTILLPWLVIKREQAEIALAMVATLGRRGLRMSASTVELRRSLKAQLSVVKAQLPTLEEVS